jgi:hypothetical protein
MKWDDADTKHKILMMVDDLVADFLFYDRKGHDEFPVGSIEKAIRDGVISADEIAQRFETYFKEFL